jgi:hypothetical protein
MGWAYASSLLVLLVPVAVPLQQAAAADIVSLVPYANCTRLGHSLCYQGAQMAIAEVVKLDPLACTPPLAARLVRGNCSGAGFGKFQGNDPIFKQVGLWGRTAPGNGSSTAAEFRRWNNSTQCEGHYVILSTDVMNECTAFDVPAPASDWVEQTSPTQYTSYHYQGHTGCTGVRPTTVGVWPVGTCSGDLGGYSQMRVWLHNSTWHCSPGCQCCPGAVATCPDCGKDVCECQP